MVKTTQTQILIKSVLDEEQNNNLEVQKKNIKIMANNCISRQDLSLPKR